MMRFRFLHIFGIISIIFILLVNMYYSETYNSAINNAHNQIKEMLLNYKALRTYISKMQKKEVYKMQLSGHIDADYFNPALLSSTFGARNVNMYYNEYKRERKEDSVVIKFASDNPRNIKNKINKEELLILEDFRKNKNKEYSKIIKVNGKKILYYAIPTKRITKDCMKCHSDPSLAPKELIDRYGDKNGFYEKEGQIRAIMLTHYPLEKELKSAYGIFINLTLVTFFAFIILLPIIYFFMKRLEDANNILDDKVMQKTKELKRLNAHLEAKVLQEVERNRQIDQQVVEHSRLAQMGEMISMIAHQWRQPLSAISSTSSSIALKAKLNKLDNNIAIDLSTKISEYTQHLSSTIDDFRDFFKVNKELNDTSYDELIEDVLKIVETSIKNKNINIIKKLDSKDIFNAYPNELKQVILNLIKNAEDILIEKNVKNPTITIQTHGRELTVSDNGGGIPENIIDKIFDIYFSTKTKKDGTGLGLYMSKIIVEGHCGGKLSVSNDKDGAVFKINLEQV